VPDAIDSVLQLRAAELRRRVDALPDEVAARQERTKDHDLDMNLHYSQLQALQVLMTTYFEQQRKLLEALDAAANPGKFAIDALALVKGIIDSQRIWNFFRTKLDLRFSPQFAIQRGLADYRYHRSRLL
jgi:hypothetical protein